MPSKPATPGTGLIGPIYVLDANGETQELPESVQITDTSAPTGSEIQDLLDAVNYLLQRIR